MLKVDNSIVIVVYKEWMKQVCMSYISIHIDPASSSGGCTLGSLVRIAIVIPHWTQPAK